MPGVVLIIDPVSRARSTALCEVLNEFSVSEELDSTAFLIRQSGLVNFLSRSASLCCQACENFRVGRGASVGRSRLEDSEIDPSARSGALSQMSIVNSHSFFLFGEGNPLFDASSRGRMASWPFVVTYMVFILKPQQPIRPCFLWSAFGRRAKLHCRSLRVLQPEDCGVVSTSGPLCRHSARCTAFIQGVRIRVKYTKRRITNEIRNICSRTRLPFLQCFGG
jgi:hypothetical protein